MLVLSRKESQRIRLGDSIVLTIVKVAGDKVRVGIQAPDDVLVLRDELDTWDDETRDAVARNAKKGAGSDRQSPAKLGEAA
ncbi:MAG: carbon storage regulator [Planctomycetota bacterium]